MITEWDKRFLIKAKEYSVWSKDPSTKIGAVAVDPNKKIIVSSGYNGFPRGIEDLYYRLHTREMKYQFMVHGEMNCIYNAVYTGVSLDQTHLYVYGLPICSKCALGVIQVGITKVFCWIENQIPFKWNEEWNFSKKLFNETNIDTVLINREIL